jgi:hypothetical protein
MDEERDSTMPEPMGEDRQVKFRFEYDPGYRQRDAFLAIPKADLLRYAGEFVLTRDGRVVDHDRDLVALTSRSGTAPVYITRVGEDIEVGIDTPFLD